MMATLGKYELYESLGRGGYGTVYRAQEPVLQVVRAVKVLHQELLADPQFIERFRLEARTAARLEHPHIVPVYELSQDQGRYFLAMKYMPGGSLKELLEKDGRLAFPRALEITRQVASALEYAHKQGVVHRDVKPANILFDEDSSVRLSDFGFSRAMQASSSGSISASGGVIGTPQYIAPEIWRGKPATAAADVYSLACVFIEMLTGQVLFSGDSPAEIMTRHILDGPQFPQTWPEGTPAHIEAVLAKALTGRPQERYAGPGEFTAALQLAAAGSIDWPGLSPPVVQTVPAAPVVPVETGKLGSAAAPKQPYLRYGLALAGVVILGLAAVILANLLFPRTPAPVQPLAAVQATDTVVSLPAAATDTTQPAYSPPPTATDTLRPDPTATRTQRPTAMFTATVDPKFPPAQAVLGDTWTSPVDGMELVYIPAGEFQMGCDRAHNGGYACEKDELPLHTVVLDAYYIDKTEVSNAQYEQCVADGACDPPTSRSSYSQSAYYGKTSYDNHPVINVSWEDASKYCEWAGRELPTEAQWEKAARGESPRAYPWDDGEPTCDLVNGVVNDSMCVGDTTAVGSYPRGASPYGVLDMAGNVWEWVRDWYSATYYSSLERFINPVGPSTGTEKVGRGGSFHSYYYYFYLRSASRDYNYPYLRGNGIGFRCAAPPAP